MWKGEIVTYGRDTEAARATAGMARTLGDAKRSAALGEAKAQGLRAPATRS